MERYDPFGNKWIMMAPLRDGVSNAAVVSAKLKLFVFGGTNIHRDKASKVGPPRPACPPQPEPDLMTSGPGPELRPRVQPLGLCSRMPSAVALHRRRRLGQIFIMGGDAEFTAASAYRFDCDTNQWTRVGDMTSKRMSCHAVASGNKLYVVGGYFGTQRCKTLDCYDPISDSWNSITTVPYSLIPTAFVSTWKHVPA